MLKVIKNSMKKIHNMEFVNGTIKINHNDDEANGKAKALCTCFIF